MNKKTIISVMVTLLVVAGGIYLIDKEGTKPSPYEPFAQCIADSGAKFYGAFWCPHCQNQKKMFGRAAKLLPYVECSTADGRSQLKICTDAGVKSYPHWVFADGTTETGEVSFEKLAEKTSCELPQI